MNRKYTIIIPIYKVEQFIEQCLVSVTKQTYSNLEIILVDDGSPDKCPEICDKYAALDNRIIVIHKKNGGLVSARKAGAKIATGDYIFCVDSDDYLELDYVQKFDEIIDNETYDVVCCGYKLATGKADLPHKVNARFGKYDKKALEKEIYPKLISSSNGSFFLPTVWAKAFKRELYQKCQLQVDDIISMGEDGAVTVPFLCQSNKVYIMEDCLYYYRYNIDSMTKSKKVLPWEGQEAVLNHLLKNVPLNKYDFQQQMYRRCVKGFFTVASSQYNSNNSVTDIEKILSTKSESIFFKNSISLCNFKLSCKANIMLFAIRHKWWFVLQLYNYFK